VGDLHGSRPGGLFRRVQRQLPGRTGDLMVVATAPGHIPVLADRSIELLRPRPGAVIVDATLGLGGHAERLLLCGATVIGLHRDRGALALGRERLPGAGDRLRTVHASFGALADALVEAIDQAGVELVDGVLYDLGVSSLQLDEGERGFSYRHDAPLDMRMDP